MPGRRFPERPVLRRSLSPDVVRYRTPQIWRLFFAFPFGLGFTFTGSLCLYVVAEMIVKSDPDWNYWIGVLALSVIGIGHVAGGLSILYLVFFWPEWVTIDRQQGVVMRQTGILCFRRKATAILADFTEVSVFPNASNWLASDSFDIALTGPLDQRFSVGQVTLSHDLAREYGGEVATFLGLPLH